MQLRLQHINKIKEAEITLKGLTVIAGANDAGKSTVGKILFTIIKSINNIKGYDENIRNRELRKRFVLLRSSLKHLSAEELVPFLHTWNLQGTDFDVLMESLFEKLVDKANWKRMDEALQSLSAVEPRFRVRVEKALGDMKQIVFRSNDASELLKHELENMIEAEFLNRICTIDTLHSQITLKDDAGNVCLNIGLEKDKVVQTDYLNEDGNLWVDATFVESPLYMHLLDMLVASQTLKEQQDFRTFLRPIVNYHIKDMAQKLDAIRYNTLDLFSSHLTNKIQPDIKAITGGNFSFDSRKRKLSWVKDGKEYAPVNVASGIKAFGVMQLLLETHSIDEDKMLIWDEPENHLHPEWQIKFAELLVRMAQAGIPIVVSSHSPYFIQAIRYFAHEQELEKFVNYYLAEETEEGLSELEDVTKDLNRLFLKLAQPMNSIVNLGM